MYTRKVMAFLCQQSPHITVSSNKGIIYGIFVVFLQI